MLGFLRSFRASFAGPELHLFISFAYPWFRSTKRRQSWLYFLRKGVSTKKNLLVVPIFLKTKRFLFRFFFFFWSQNTEELKAMVDLKEREGDATLWLPRQLVLL